MSQYTTGVNYNTSSGFFEVTKVDSTGKVSTESVNFSALCMMFSLESLSAQDAVFAAQFAEAEAQVNQLTMINDCMQMFNKYSAQFENSDKDSIMLEGSHDDMSIEYAQKMLDANHFSSEYVHYAGEDKKWTQEELDQAMSACAADNGSIYTTIDGVAVMYDEGTDMDMWVSVYYPALVESGLVESSISPNGVFTQSELSATMENLQSAQSTVSSQNEQQMLLTNDAANKRSSILQQAQTLLQAAHDARKTAAQT